MDREQPGGAHSLWIGSDETTLFVSSTGHETAEVSLDPAALSGVLNVALRSAVQGTFEVLFEGSLSSPLRTRAFAWLDAEAQLAGRTPTWQGSRLCIAKRLGEAHESE